MQSRGIAEKTNINAEKSDAVFQGSQQQKSSETCRHSYKKEAQSLTTAFKKRLKACASFYARKPRRMQSRDTAEKADIDVERSHAVR